METKDIVFGLDIGTRNVIGTVGYLDGDEFHVIAQDLREHDTRAMLDGQIHDIGRVGATCDEVKKVLEEKTGFNLTEVCIAAAGRVLRTVTTHVEMEYPEETVVTGEDLHTLDMMGIEQAGKELKGDEDKKYKFFCVGYSTVKYYLNGDVFTSLEDHKAEVIGEDIIVTFLPEDVVDGLYSAVGKADLSVANLTLEPIAAINVAIPQNFRMLNIALIDVGAGTSDICVTRDGSIIAYGMIPMAGDELTEVLVHEFLVDFATAETIKRASTEGGDITYEDIMGISHTIKSEEVWKLTDPVMEKIAHEVASKIQELNGGKSVSAAFVVGGGGKVHGFTEALAKDLKIVPERVALRGEEVMKNIIFEEEDVKKDSLLVTPIGICLNYYETKNNFIMIHFNGEMMKLYDNGQLTIVDAAMQAGFSADQLFPRRGREVNFTVNGVSRMIRGTEGESAVVTMNGRAVGINTPLEFNADVTLVPSTVGEGGTGTIADLAEFTTDYLYFTVCGHRVKCPKFVEVNGSMEPPTYIIKEGDVIETRPFYTVGQLAEFMDVTIDDRYEILVNNRPSGYDSLVYENFVIDWTTTSPVAYAGDYIVEDGEGMPEDYVPPQAEEEPVKDARTKIKIETVDLPIKINGKNMVLSGKKDYIFVDIYNLIDFDPNAGNGRPLVIRINGEKCGYADELHANDEVECYWQ
ncbi:cell division FtsA domain-containing protein [Pseudobutyrivibrio sp.]|uniref:cell division FtsA domain-containing protein n=1 Tax=Pseudobutyrivibrio sp. TaxID=2014367 RepID=UPI001B5FCE7E|nr:cell division FtsA domain-containing protein [Pseudobutyrivibrio sp.]MBP3262906.1 rod shape-determining protein [Pseudobutyrivibrio sp.]